MTDQLSSKDQVLPKNLAKQYQGLFLISASLISLCLILVPVEISAIAFPAVIFVIAVFATLFRNIILLVALLLISSAIQRVLQTVFNVANFLLIDDLVLLASSLFLIFFKMNKILNNWKTSIYALLFVAVLIFAYINSIEPSIGLYQLRQIFVPIILIGIGFVIRESEIRFLFPLVLSLALVAVVFSIPEFFGNFLVNPTNYSGFEVGTLKSAEASNLPGFYTYHFTDGFSLRRIGSFFLNPPSYGIYLASAFLWTKYFFKNHKNLWVVAIYVTLTIGIFSSLSRAGILIWLIAVLQPFLTKKLGKYVFIVLALIIGSGSITSLSNHGASVKHTQGALSGLEIAISHPFGIGFGYVGNRASLLFPTTSEASESFSTILLAATGWIGLFLLIVLLWKGILSGAQITGVVVTSGVIVCMFTETISGLDASCTFWILFGYSLHLIKKQSLETTQ